VGLLVAPFGGSLAKAAFAHPRRNELTHIGPPRCRTDQSTTERPAGGSPVYELSVALVFLLLLLGSFWAGLTVQKLLREHHRSRDSVESIRVVFTLLVTFAALVLGLLISSTQTRYSTFAAGLRGLSVDITELDQRLRQYGPAADPLRADLILYTKAAIADTWPDETPPSGAYPTHLNPLIQGGVESVELGAVLNRIDLGIRRLTPDDAFQRSVASSLQSRMVDLLQQRWNLIASAQGSLSWPFLAILMFWLVVIFVIAGLSSPRNVVVVMVTTLAALSISSSIFLAVDLDRPLTGFIKVSSASMRDALLHLTQPPVPEAP
jgi:hypothetical protein